MSYLPNIGIDLGFKHGPVRRMIFCLTTDDSNDANVIAQADAAAIANWQTQFNKWSTLSDYSDRFIPTPLLREVAKEDIEQTDWEVEDYKRKMRNGYADISAALLDPAPYILKNLAVWEDYTISTFFVCDDNKALGIKDGSNLKPYPIKLNSLSVPYWTPGGYDEGSRNVFSFRLNAGSDLNESIAVTIADADVTSDSDFYGLRDCSVTVASPAVTGCTFTPTVDDTDPDAASTAIPVAGITYDEVVFVKKSDSSEVSLAAAGSISYASGVYTVNELTLLTADTTYSLRVRSEGFDIPLADVVVPA